MSEQQAAYILNPHYQEWVLDQDEADDLVSIPADHVHKWNLIVDGESEDGVTWENTITAWCQCTKTLSQSEIEATLNKAVQP